MSVTATLYEWAGGEAAIRRLMDCFYDRVERDELLSPYFPGGVSEEHRAHVSTWWSEVLGGPARYTDDLGGYEQMLAHHRGLAIAPEERHRFVSLLSLAADDAGLPDDPEFRSALVAYAEWGSRIAMHNSQPDAQVIEHAPCPSLGLGRGASLSALGRRSILPRAPDGKSSDENSGQKWRHISERFSIRKREIGVPADQQEDQGARRLAGGDPLESARAHQGS
jgi:hemoglobin